MAKLMNALLIALVATCGLVSARDLKQAPAPAPMPMSVVDLVANNPDFSILAAAVTALDLTSALGPNFAGTVFAPTNAAFEKLLMELGVANPVDLLTSSPDLVLQVLKLHVSPTKAKAADLSVGAMLPTLDAGAVITVETLTPTVTITAGGNTATVIKTDLMAGNAIVHVIDTVLLPAMGPAPAPAMEMMGMTM